MRRASCAALVVVSMTAGCYHYTADIPGVLDTRSDGSTADPSAVVVEDPALRREGLSSFIDGPGVTADGALVTVEERHFFAGVTPLTSGAFLLSNPSAAEELEAALGEDALRDVRLGHSYSALDVLMTGLTFLVPCVPLLLAPQPYTFTARGERIAAGGRAPANRPVAPPVEPPNADVDAEADPDAAPQAPEAEPSEEGESAEGARDDVEGAAEPRADAPATEGGTP